MWPPPGLWMLLCKCADTVSSSSLSLNICVFSSIPDFHRPLFLRVFPSPPQPALFLSAPHAQPGSRALMHHGTFCSSQSQCDQALRSDRMATSLRITTHRRSAVPGPVWGKDAGGVVGVRVEDEGGEEGRVLPLTGTITSTDSEINGLRAEEAPKHFNTTCEIRCVKPYYRCNLYPCSCNADNVMCWFSRVWWKSNICAPEQLDGFYWRCDRNNHWPVWWNLPLFFKHHLVL